MPGIEHMELMGSESSALEDLSMQQVSIQTQSSPLAAWAQQERTLANPATGSRFWGWGFASSIGRPMCGR